MRKEREGLNNPKFHDEIHNPREASEVTRDREDRQAKETVNIL